MNKSIAFVGMTHLGLVSAVAAAEKGFQVICFDPNLNLIDALNKGDLSISEPDLPEFLMKNLKQGSLSFTADPGMIKKCSVVYVAPDVSTNEKGESDLNLIDQLLDIVFENTSAKNTIVILSQVPPGYTRTKLRHDTVLYYQVETLIFGQAISRALFPERFMIGCLDPDALLPSTYQKFLESHSCPILKMRYESAELAKISINMCLVASISVANTLAELCEEIGANWSEIIPALRLDKRIGEYSYLNPGLGISGGNLERDLATVLAYSNKLGTDNGTVKAWIENSKRRKNWLWTTLRKTVWESNRSKRVGVLGLTYKENTHSLKNSPALFFLSKMAGCNVVAYDPAAALDAAPIYVNRANSMFDVLDGADILILATPWPEFSSISTDDLIEKMRGRIVIDPYGMFNEIDLKSSGFSYFKLGTSL
jgi:UDPglucose 6-dehydrogenase